MKRECSRQQKQWEPAHKLGLRAPLSVASHHLRYKVPEPRSQCINPIYHYLPNLFLSFPMHLINQQTFIKGFMI